MRMLPINNYEPSSKARFSKHNVYNVESLIEMAKFRDGEAGIPKLYTLLDLLDKHSGKVAKILSDTERNKYHAMGLGPYTKYYSLDIDDVEIKREPERKAGAILDLLQSAMTDYQTKDGKTISMPQSVFDAMWWKNRDKTVDDVKKFALEA